MLPYYPISQFYSKKFGEKVWKIPVSVAQTCPNREGLRGMKQCNFCDVWGSAAYPENRSLELKNQIEITKERLAKRYNTKKFLVYFQAYTSTFSKVNQLRQNFEVATTFADVCGLVVGTRPDCISDSVFELWNEYASKLYLGVEFGVQSFDEEQLIWMSRGHTASQSIRAILRTKKECPNIDLGIHLMFGLPGETDQQMVATARLINELPIDNVKLHNLHVLKNTPLEQDYLQGKFEPMGREEYAQRVGVFLSHLKPTVAVHRLTAVASRHEEIAAPMWVGNKMASYQFMLDWLNERKITQGLLFNSDQNLKQPQASLTLAHYL